MSCKFCAYDGIPFNNLCHREKETSLGLAQIDLDMLFDPKWDKTYDGFALEASFTMDGEHRFSKSVRIKYCPMCGRKLQNG